MEWIEENESGLPDMDGQHREIFQLIQQVSECDSRSERGDTRGMIALLEQRASHHFEQEERLMAAYSYPEAVHHAAEHALLLRELKGYQGNTSFNARQFNLVLSNWLMSHTLMEDRPFATFVLERRADGQGLAEGLLKE